MKYIRRIMSFWYHFIVGDDWRIAAGVVLSLSLVTLFVHDGQTQVWWLLPLIVIVMLTLSLHLAINHK